MTDWGWKRDVSLSALVSGTPFSGLPLLATLSSSAFTFDWTAADQELCASTQNTPVGVGWWTRALNDGDKAVNETRPLNPLNLNIPGWKDFDLHRCARDIFFLGFCCSNGFSGL